MYDLYTKFVRIGDYLNDFLSFMNQIGPLKISK